MNRRNSTSKKSNKSKEFVKIYNALRKLENIFREDPSLMLQLSEYLIKENTLSATPNSSNVCNWVLRWTNILITMTDARSLLTYASLQLAKNSYLKHCSLLPPSKNDYERWFQKLRTISEETNGGGFHRPDEEVKVFKPDEHLLQKKKPPKLDQRSSQLRGKEDPTLHMFPSITGATASSLPQLKPILRIPSKKNLTAPSATEVMSPIKFKKTSTSMAYKKHGSIGGYNDNNQMSVSDMVALARKKQHYERLRRVHEEELNFGKNSIDYGIANKKETRVVKRLPSLKSIMYNDKLDEQLFGKSSDLQNTVNNFGIYGSPKGVMSKAKPQFQKESARVTNEVYQILGVRSDKTVRPRKY
jgi:hypothetical protein